MQKNEEYIVDIIDNGFEGEGIAKLEDKTIFIQNAIKGEKVKIKILKVNKNICFAKIVQILEKSGYRNDNDCDTYGKCGGCNFRHIDYKKGLEIKKKSVEQTLRKALGRDISVEEVIGMEKPEYYRNKLQYPVGVNRDGETVMGVFAERSHRIIEVNDCKIQNKKCQKVANDILKFLKQNKISGYDEQSGSGIFRHVICRIGIKTDEILVTLVVNNLNIPKEKELIDYIIKNNPKVKSIAKNLNNKNTNVILGDKTEIIYGPGYIYDYIGDKKFKISPLSFYQVNPVQTEKLYDKAIEYARLTGEETIFDLYCGIGTIGICASDKVKKLYGIETIDAAIKDARVNAELNNIKNAEFFTRKCRRYFARIYKDKKYKTRCCFC